MGSGGGDQGVSTAGCFHKSELLNALDSIRTNGPFASPTQVRRSEADIFPQHVDRVHIPPSEAQASQPAMESHQGKASEIPTADWSLQHHEARRVLELWSQEIKTGSRRPSPLYYVLRHKYAEANLSIQGLRPSDLSVVKYLEGLCAELNFDIFLNVLEKGESGTVRRNSRELQRDHYGSHSKAGERTSQGPSYHHLDEITDLFHRCKYVFDLYGNKLTSNPQLEEEDILQEQPFGEAPDDEDIEGSSGKFGSRVIHRYRLWALAIVPSDGTVSFLTSSTQNHGSMHGLPSGSHFRGLFDYFINKCGSCPENSQPLAQLHEFLRTASRNPLSDRQHQLTAVQFSKALQASIRGHEPGLLDLILSQNSQEPPISFFIWIRDQYDKSAISIADLEKLLIHAIRLQSSVYQVYNAVSFIDRIIYADDRVKSIVSRAIDEYLGKCRTKDLYEEDGPAIFDLAMRYQDFNYLKTVVIPLIEENSESLAFVLGFLRSLYQSIERQQIALSEARFMYEHIAWLALNNIEVASISAIDYRQQGKGNWRRLEDIPHFEHLTYDSMLGFVSTLIALNLDGHIRLLAEKISTQAENIKGREFKPFWIPLLQGLFPVFEQYRVPLPSPHWTRIYQLLFQAYLSNFVQKPPSGVPISRQRISCNCKDCINLNQFLASPAEAIGRFPVDKNRRTHLHDMLDMAGADCTIQHEEERSGSPQTLVVKKTTSQSDEAMDAWWERRLQAERQLKAFNQTWLRVVLGDWYDNIMGMSLLNYMPTSTSRALSLLSQRPVASLASTSHDIAGQSNVGMTRLPSLSSVVPSPSMPGPVPTYPPMTTESGTQPPPTQQRTQSSSKQRPWLL
ncbi:uncharacterized protein F4822DRAFT_401332 [Hypoxylon trugodes]|uniref:uncharacterized protein n=1 Tax=Hypoxylon trugodes TaxID=326681 RepID=UPI002199EEC9|nr:uncharacterized protein F4822DRAFT_401332 [Hypoxylon trugodes]KAI1390244.1 hypothetical protein F4822DRAFT_401332 [Hypoxylon trugodes]